MKARTGYSIGDVAQRLSTSADTLRYYERIGLLPRVARTRSGRRAFDDGDLARLRFIRRAQVMNFTLAEIAALLELRDRRGRSKAAVRAMARIKLREIDDRVAALVALRDELKTLVEACPGPDSDCPILRGIEERASATD